MRQPTKFNKSELKTYAKTHRVTDVLKRFRISIQTYYKVMGNTKREDVYNKKAGIIAKGLNQYNDPYVFDFTIMIKNWERAY